MASGPLFVSSGDLIADRRYQWALDHAARGDFSDAADILRQTVELVPAFATAWFALGAIRETLGDRAGAVLAFRAAGDADSQDYHGARLQLARLGAGEATPAMTAIYVRRLFDQHAASFDESLTARLSYSGPQLLLDAVTRACGVASRPLRFATMLDLGCGTGLAGVKFRAQVQNLVGIDLSSAMIEQARVKNIYDRLEAVELTEFLAAEATRGAKVDLVVAADVFVYISDLAPVAAAVALALARDGLFAFTVETHEGDGVLLQPTLRYAHSASHVRDALEGAGLAPLLLEPASPRTEKGLPVNGLVAVAAPKIRSAVP